MLRTDGRVRILLMAALAAFVLVLSGCGQTVAGTPHPEGEGPSPTAAGTEAPTATPEPGPPTSFQEPSGRPTVTVQPDETLADGAGPGSATSAPAVPGPLSGLAAPTPEPTVGPRTTGDRSAPAVPAPGQDGGAAPAPARARATAPAQPRVVLAAPAPLTADVVRDECLLGAAGFAALLGTPVTAPAENTVTRADGTSTRSCYAAARSGSATAAVNVYRVNQGTPASFVRATSGGRPIPGIGEAAVLLETVGGSALQVATPRFLVTISAVDGTPSGDRWAAAGRAVADAAGRL